jgi:alanine racemase
VEVNAAALRRNAERVRELVGPGTDVLPVVKANGYGLGMSQVVDLLESTSPWGYGVGTVEEGRTIRSYGVTRPILVLAPIPPGEVEAAVGADLRLAISSIDSLRRVSDAATTTGRNAVVHVEVDTGIGRAGLPWGGANEWGPRVLAETGERVRWEGIFTHFLGAGDLESDAISEQADRFSEALDALAAVSPSGWIAHMCNSAGLLRRADLHMQLVRPGMFLYGGRMWPGLPQAEPVVSVRARVVLTRDVPRGTTVGYGATHRAEGEECWATLGIGYGDGIPRSLGNGGAVLLRGRRVPIIGRISMGMIVVDITSLRESSVEVGEEVTLIGEDGGERISVDEVARLSGTISYEVLTRLSPRLPRVWL